LVAVAAGSLLVALAWRAHKERGEASAAGRVFAFSIFYLVIMFSGLLLDHLVGLQGSGAV
jgi:heme O synthase-like polyprenyltransferase